MQFLQDRGVEELPSASMPNPQYEKIYRPFLPGGAWIGHIAKAIYLYGETYEK